MMVSIGLCMRVSLGPRVGAPAKLSLRRHILCREETKRRDFKVQFLHGAFLLFMIIYLNIEEGDILS